jgi:hypothetical protein
MFKTFLEASFLTKNGVKMTNFRDPFLALPNPWVVVRESLEPNEGSKHAHQNDGLNTVLTPKSIENIEKCTHFNSLESE